MKLATVRDVARRAGVSHTTVSRVINGGSIVTEGTRKLVEDAISALGFAPNPAARALSGAEHVRIGLLHRFPNPGSLGEFLVHLLDNATRAHASLVVREVAGEQDHANIVNELMERGVRGVILPPPLGDDTLLLQRLLALDFAVVATGSNRQGKRLASVGVNDREAARAMTEHLLGLGHLRIGFISGDPNYASADLRLLGYRDAMKAAGLPSTPSLVTKGLYNYQSGLDAAEQLLTITDRPTAIFASNDDMAAATIAVAHRLGFNVPDDLSVCGFDDSPLATTIWPMLTTIRRPTVEITREAIKMILTQLNDGRPSVPEDGHHVILDHLLVRRQSDAVRQK